MHDVFETLACGRVWSNVCRRPVCPSTALTRPGARWLMPHGIGRNHPMHGSLLFGRQGYEGADDLSNRPFNVGIGRRCAGYCAGRFGMNATCRRFCVVFESNSGSFPASVNGDGGRVV